MTDAYELSAEAWAHERHYMAKAGFDDLYHVSIGACRKGQSVADLKTTISTGFDLVADGLELQSDALAPNLVEFLAAADVVDLPRRTELMRLALRNLSKAVGFDIGP